MRDDSFAYLGQRVPKSKLLPFGWRYARNVDPDEVAIVALPGSNADNSKKANGFAKMIEEILEDKNIPIYSIEYELNERNSVADRIALLRLYNQDENNDAYKKFHPEEDDYIPNYVREIYKSTLSPRLKSFGKRTSLKKISERLNKIIFINHCQGSTVAFQLERLMVEELTSLGYSKKEQDHILRQVHNIDIAPVSPIGKTKTTTIKFASLSDDKVTSIITPKTKHILNRKKEHKEFLEKIGSENKENIAPKEPFTMNFSVFRPTPNETIFAVNNIYPLEILDKKCFDGIEHVFSSFSDEFDEDRTKQGNLISQAFIKTVNILVNHAKQNQKNFTELKDILEEASLKPLVKIAQKNFYKLKKNELRIIRQNEGR